MLSFLKITGFGYLAIALLALSWFLSYKISARAKDTGLLSKLFTWIVCMSIILIFASTLYMSCQRTYQYFAGTPYNGKISAYTSYQEDYKNSGETRTRTRSMYVPMVQFVDKKGEQHTLPSNSHSGALPIVGQELKILHIQGQKMVLEVTFTNYILLLVAFLFASLFGFFSKAIVDYAFGKTAPLDVSIAKWWFLRSIYISLSLWGMVSIWSIIR